MPDFLMPSLGADMEAATLTKWLVGVGDHVARGQAVAVVETQKGLIDIETFVAGRVAELLVEPGARVPVGTPLARIDDGAPAAAAAPVRGRVSPAARRRAQELGVDVDALAATAAAPITVDDVERAAPHRAAADAGAMRRAVGAAMARAKREIPHYYLATEVDVEPAFAWLETANATRPVGARLLLGALLVGAVARAACEFPDFNGWWRDGAFVRAERVNVGMAIALRGGGLVAPALLDADRCALDELMRRLLDLVNRARSGRLRGSELAEATITVSSLGEQGVDAVFPIIHAPQVAIVGFGTPARRPRLGPGGALEARRVLQASLAGDHRVGDGQAGARFLARVRDLIERPQRA